MSSSPRKFVVKCPECGAGVVVTEYPRHPGRYRFNCARCGYFTTLTEREPAPSALPVPSKEVQS